MLATLIISLHELFHFTFIFALVLLFQFFKKYYKVTATTFKIEKKSLERYIFF